MDEELFSIGKFSKICSISIQALRYYDKIGILKPKFIDTETRYRFYGTDQTVIVMIIQKMAVLGLSLSEIDVFLHRNDMLGIKSIFDQKRQEIKEQINELLYADKTLKLYIDNINMYKNADFSCIEIKKVPIRNVIYLRRTIELNENGFTKLFNDAMKIVGVKKYLTIGNPMAIYYGERILGEPCDIKLCIELEEAYTSEENCKIIQGGYYLSKMHLGAHANKPKTYGQLLDYANRNKLSVIGKPVEVYYIDISITRNPDDFITEIQIPIKNKLTL
ncbi:MULTISPECIES: MerR family transcriptional regulator [unclassified Clostridium]|uniref:MerR family transcriptional regulator n=1 Tax=unclassified Clostridium TaxID=2614128 RepID=UPI0002981061|nr:MULTISPECIES: MerR family transcriptional regulator [unclassified Clostridium]EKQ55900.1 MAG: putative transcriptional regulator [Clostridium sp. Maddingley MBC34-26]